MAIYMWREQEKPRPTQWTPSNPYFYYKFNGDYSDETNTFADATGNGSFQTLDSWIQVLQTDGNIITTPSSATDTAITTYTIAFRMKVITTSPTYGYYAWSGDDDRSAMAFYESTAGRCYFEWWSGSGNNTRDITPSWIGTWWRLVCLRSNWTSRSAVSLLINWQYEVTSGGTGWPDSSSIFGYTVWPSFSIWARHPTSWTTTEQRTNIQFSNFVISHTYWDTATCLAMYNDTKSMYWLS